MNSPSSSSASRLVRPTSRISFTATNQTSSFGAQRAPTSSFQPKTAGNQMQQTSGPNYSSLAGKQQQVANANISGLPVSRLRPLASNSTPSSTNTTHTNRQAVSGVPSTVGSAIRTRRPVAPPVTNSPGLQRAGSHLQSATLIPAQFRPTNTCRYQTKQTDRREENKGDELQAGGGDDDQEEDSRCVESLPPLKSTSYISRLARCNPADQTEPLSEPINTCSASHRSPKQAADPDIEKPSQLVKPLVNDRRPLGSAPNRRSMSANRMEPKSQLAMPTSSRGQSQTPVARSAVPSLLRFPQVACRTNNPAGHSPQQHSGYNSISLQLTGGKQQQEADTSRIHPGEDTGEDGDENDEEESDEDEDATSAETITDNANELNLDNANRELNNMIEMLTSSRILNESESSLSSNRTANIHRRQSSVQTRLPEINQTRLATSAPSKILKSQSLSFNGGAHCARRPLVGPQRLARPQSKIIFDPTNNQFHVSCNVTDSTATLNATNDDCSEMSYSDSTTTSSSNNNNNDIETKAPDSTQTDARCSTTTNDSPDDDESSSKLRDAQSRLYTLKYLPLQDDIVQDANSNDTDTIKRLKDCKGSLESLITIRTTSSNATYNDSPGPANEQQQQVAARQRASPFGSALRSLFGLHNNSNSLRPQTPPDERSTTDELRGRTNRVATIVRHASLRSDPRRRLSASSSSLTNKFKYMMNSSTTNITGTGTTTTTTTTRTINEQVSLFSLSWGARTKQVRVAKCVVHSAHCGPDFACWCDEGCRKGSLFARIRPVPLGGADGLLGVRRHLDWVDVFIESAAFDVAYLAPDLQQSLTVVVQLLLVL